MNTRHYPFVPLIYVGFLLLPIYWLLAMAFKPDAEITNQLTFWSRHPTLQNFQTIFTVRDWWIGYVHAIIYVVMNVVISVCFAIPAAYGFSRGRFPLKTPLFFSFLAFRLIAPVILVVPFTEIFYDLGLFDTHIAVALAHCYINLPIAVWILEGAISAIPKEVDESAFVDGYALYRFLVRVLIPTIAPSIAVAGFFCFMFSWVEYVLAGALTAVDTKPINGIISRVGDIADGDYGMLAAVSVLGFIPGMIFMLMVRRHLVQGFLLGRLK
jgi:glycerol transport system permease protein